MDNIIINTLQSTHFKPTTTITNRTHYFWHLTYNTVIPNSHNKTYHKIAANYETYNPNDTVQTYLLQHTTKFIWCIYRQPQPLLYPIFNTIYVTTRHVQIQNTKNYFSKFPFNCRMVSISYSNKQLISYILTCTKKRGK